MRINSVMVSERVGEDWLVLDPDTSQVHQLSGLSAEVFSAAIAGTEVPVGCEHAVAALVTANILTVDNPPNHRSLLNGTTTAAAPGISRRRLISTGALAAGAATLAATVGIHTFILPTAASAQSPSATLAAPTGVTATVDRATAVAITWDLVPTATTYQVYVKLSSASTYATSGGPVANGPATVSGLTTGSPYDFYVVAIAGGTTSLPSTVATATPAALAGIDWTSRTTPTPSSNWTSVTYGNGLFVAVANGGDEHRVMTSPDGTTWTARTAPYSNWRSVTYGEPSGEGPLFVAVAGSFSFPSEVMTSPDGINWTTRTTGLQADFDSNWNDVTFGNGLFVAVASDGFSSNRVMTSPDGINWTISASAPNNYWRSVTYGEPSGVGPLFVAVPNDGGNQVMTSPDGINWTTRTAPDSRWNDVTFGNGLFVAVAGSFSFFGDPLSNRVMTSPDGIDWTVQTAAVDNNWRSVTFRPASTGVDPLFVAVAESGTANRVMTSPDGINWTTRTAAADIFWQSVTYGNGRFVAVDTAASGDQVMTSP